MGYVDGSESQRSRCVFPDELSKKCVIHSLLQGGPSDYWSWEKLPDKTFQGLLLSTSSLGDTDPGLQLFLCHTLPAPCQGPVLNL